MTKPVRKTTTSNTKNHLSAILLHRRAATLLAAGALACGEPGGEPSGQDGATAPDDVEIAATTEDVFTVGAFSGDDWETFGNVAAVDFDADGNLHILDRSAARVVVVDRAGQLVRTVGSKGEGPGELANPMSFSIMSDGKTVIFDMGLPGAFEVFDQAGEFVNGITIDMADGRMPGSDLHPMADGRLLSAGGTRIRMAGFGGGDGGDDAAEEPELAHLRDLDVFSLDGSERDVFYRAWNLPPPTGEGERVSGGSASGTRIQINMGRQRAFSPGLEVAVLSDGRVAVADSMGYRVKLLAPDGSVAGAIGRPIPPEPVTEAIAEAERARRLEAAQGDNPLVRSGTISIVSGSGGQMPAGLADQLQEAMIASVETLAFPEVIPVVDEMAVDSEDRIWVARTAPGGSGEGPIDLLTAAGDYLGTLPADGPRIPDAFGPDGLMAYIETGELDVPVVRVARLVSAGGR